MHIMKLKNMWWKSVVISDFWHILWTGPYGEKKSQVEKIMQTKAKFLQKLFLWKEKSFMHIMNSKNSSMNGKLRAIYEKSTNSLKSTGEKEISGFVLEERVSDPKGQA